MNNNFNAPPKDILITQFISDYLSQSSKNDCYRNKYRVLMNDLNDFSKTSNKDLQLSNFTENKLESFYLYLRDKGFRKNTIRIKCANLRHMLEKAGKLGYAVNMAYLDFSKQKEDADKVYLSMEEIIRIMGLKIKSKTRQIVRDLFIMGCFTALRYSDFTNLTEYNLNERYIKILTQKTKNLVVIPLHPIVMDILTKNKGIPQYKYSYNAFHYHLRLICKAANIDNDTLIQYELKGKIVKEVKKKYELITSHTARRTAATNMYLAGIPVFRIMLITGHKSESSFFRYIRITNEENAKTLSEHEFFRK